jgi:isocitrate lyase
MPTREQQAGRLQEEWDSNARWNGVVRNYTAADVVRLRGSLAIDYTLATRGADALWRLLHGSAFVNALGAMSGNQAVQQVKAGLKAVYLSGSPGAGDPGGEVYSDHAFYSAHAVPDAVRRIHHAFRRADQMQWAGGKGDIDYFAPIVADGEAGFGGARHAYEVMKSMIDAGAAGVHFADQLASPRMGGKVLLPTREAIEKLTAARLAADVMGVPTLLIARTDAEAADLLTTDIDPVDRPFCTGERTADGFYKVRPGIEQAIARALAYAPFADLLWCETSKPDLAFAKQFAQAVHAKFPGKLLAYHCSPSFNWKKNLDDATIAKFQKELGAMGYKFQFITLAGCHALNDGMFHLAHGYARRGMTAFVELQEAEFAAAQRGFTAGRHQREVGTGHVDAVLQSIEQRQRSTLALGATEGATEDAQFFDDKKVA